MKIIFPQIMFKPFSHTPKQVLSALLLCSVFFAASAQAESSVWVVEKVGEKEEGAEGGKKSNKVYLGGTIHLLQKADFPLPEEFSEAYSFADKVYFETDVQEMETPEMAAKTVAAMTYSDGRTLQAVLNSKTYQQVSDYFATKGIPIAAFNGFKAGAVGLTITVMELQSLGYTTEGVDAHYLDKARADGKRVGFFETVEEQLGFISALGEGIENEFVSSSLLDAESLESLFDEMKAAWNKGDMDALNQLMIAELERDFPAVYDSLLVQRNDAWLPEIEAMLSTEEVEFVLVGAGHMAGKDGVIQKLIKNGYKVSKL